MLRGAGIVALFVLAACNQSSPAPRVSPSVPAVQASWNQDLTFKGEVTGHMSGILPNTATQSSGCTGAKPRTGSTWSDKFYGLIDSSGNIWEIVFVIANYAGPGTYRGSAVAVDVQNTNNTSKEWLNQSADAVTFTLQPSQETGTIDALLTNAFSGKAGAVHLTGTWNCQA